MVNDVGFVMLGAANMRADNAWFSQEVHMS
jgi:hypothetical protein